MFQWSLIHDVREVGGQSGHRRQNSQNVTDAQPQPLVSLKLLPVAMIDFQSLNEQTLQHSTHESIVLLAAQFYKGNSCHAFKSFIIFNNKKPQLLIYINTNYLLNLYVLLKLFNKGY